MTLVSWGAMINETMKAAEELAAKGIQCEVVDVASISPLDHKTIVESVKKTGHCVIVHEAARSCGVGSEIAAHLSEYAFPYLKAPVSRITGYDTIMPYFKNEDYYLPKVEQIVELVMQTCGDNNTKVKREVHNG